MTVAQILARSTAAGVSSSVVCTGGVDVTVGLYTAGNSILSERVGARLQIQNPLGFEDYKDIKGRLVVLTQICPVYTITHAGTYQVVKDASTTSIGVFADAGA